MKVFCLIGDCRRCCCQPESIKLSNKKYLMIQQLFAIFPSLLCAHLNLFIFSKTVVIYVLPTGKCWPDVVNILSQGRFSFNIIKETFARDLSLEYAIVLLGNYIFY